MGEASSQGGEASAARALYELVRDHRLQLLAIVAASTPIGFVEAAAMALVAEAAVAMANGTDVSVALGPFMFHATVARALAIAFWLTVLRLGLRLLTAYLPARIVAAIQAAIRVRLFGSFVAASWELQSQERDGHLQEVMTQQVQRVANLAMAVTSGLSAALVFMGMLVSAFAVSPVAAAGTLVVGLLLFGLLRPLARVARTASAAMSEASLRLAHSLSEGLRLAEEHKVFGTGSRQSAVVTRRIDDVRQPTFRAMFATLATSSAYQGIVMLVLVIGLALLRQAGSADLGQLGAAVLILLRSLAYGQALQGAYTSSHDLMPFLHKVQGTLAGYSASGQTWGALEYPEGEVLQLEDVSYRYPGGPEVVHGVNLEIAPARVLAIVGPSGAGKSTLVQLVLGLRRPSSGRVMVGGIAAADIRADGWRSAVAYVGQDTKLIDGTVSDNIRFFRDIPDADVRRAAILAGIHGEIMGWDGDYERRVGQRADAVSGGQRQRLCLARALASRPRVLVLDEPTSALDSDSEKIIQGTVSRLAKAGMAVVLVTHRPGLLAGATDALVLRDGRVAASGPLKSVVAQDTFAARLFSEGRDVVAHR